ncbi:tetratricopeptide repeat protein [Evansella cellulosilytica]|uniref:Tetratricopeptide TPR_1 repeat-containing protein n=1 Tax=Evansella cellulosilytica (strain ATCC 21833 / DSM 2522 / FERM P-1141 / JCM 9156 / N-4) TaxID=649639 RepID=E6TZH3_EVAC2|nr:tetratricopeptide repeat protein [Evansella cellulosilytica]ADU30147.1 Tetratricopeptide TPR_1 repeat-containing protein [Evansella cellulosilytica DSM 2522]
MNDQLHNAIQLIEEGMYEEGLQKLSEISKEANDDILREICEIYFELGLVDKALVLLEDLMFRYPDHGELFVFAAECYSELGKEDEAVDMLTEIHKDDPVFVQAQLLLADIYQGQGLEEVAEQKLLQAEKVAPEEAILLYGIGEFYLDRGEYQRSIPYFKKVIHDHKLDDSNGLNPALRLAEAFSTSGQFEDALTYYEKGLKDKEDLDGIFGWGYTALQLGEYDVAIKQFERLKNLDENYTTVYTYLGKSLKAKNKLKEALEILHEGIMKDEYNEELYLEMAKVQFMIGNREEGKSFLEKVIAINPSNVSAVKELLLYFHQIEDYEGLLQLLSFLEEYGEYDPVFERYKGKALYEEDDIAKAVIAYENALHDIQEDYELMEEAAYVFLEAGHREKAIALLEKVFATFKDRFDIEERLQQLKID